MSTLRKDRNAITDVLFIEASARCLKLDKDGFNKERCWVGGGSTQMSLLLVAGIVRRVNIIDLEGTDAVDLDNGLPFRRGEMPHALGH